MFDSNSIGKISRLSLWYGLTVLLVSATATMVLTPNAFNGYISGETAMYLVLSAIPAFAIFIYRTGRYGSKHTLNPLEIIAAFLSGIGLSLPLATIGLLLAAITRGEYKGVEKWLPEVEDLETLVQNTVTELELSEETRNQSMQLLGKMRDKGLIKGRPAPELAGAIVYIASRQQEEPRTLDEISDATGADKKAIGRTYRNIARNTDIRILPPRPSNYVERFADSLDLPDNVKERAKELIEMAEEESFTSGKSPRGIAASALYLATHQEGEYRSMNETSNVLDVTTITIRERSKEFIRKLGLEDYPEHLEQGL